MELLRDARGGVQQGRTGPLRMRGISFTGLRRMTDGGGLWCFDEQSLGYKAGKLYLSLSLFLKAM